MACFTIIAAFESLRHDVGDVFTQGSDADEFLSAVRAAGAQALLTVPEFASTDAVGRFDVAFQFGDKRGTNGDEDPVQNSGYFRIVIDLLMDNRYALGYRLPGSPAQRAARAVVSSFSRAFDELPNSGADFMAALGATSPVIEMRMTVDGPRNAQLTT